MNCSCLFCKKPKFNIERYGGKYVMHVTTEEQAKIFCEYLHSVGQTWIDGDSYIKNYSHFITYKDNTCYCFGKNTFADVDYYRENEYKILEFDDFDWSDFTMKKEFTKAYLKNGDVVKCKSGDIGIVCVDTGTIVLRDGCFELCLFDEYLRDTKADFGKDCTIVAVRRPKIPTQCRFDAFSTPMGLLIYERKEVEEMTLEEVCKALGKEIKIVKNKEK